MNRRVLIVDDEPRFLELCARTLRDAGLTVDGATSADEALPRLEGDAAGRPALVITDVRMPGTDGLTFLRRARERHPELPFLLVTAYAEVREAVAALKLGAVDYLAKPVDLDELVACVRDALELPPTGSLAEVPSELRAGIISHSAIMNDLLRDAYRISQSDATVLITGESGTGKEVIARFLHHCSARRHRALVCVNCAAVPSTLLAGELFGYEKGAFTGATARREGRFREADGGTLFLDEIGDMPLELQPVLLRAIETHRVSPLGGRGEVEVDLRLIAATHRDLEADIAAGRFRPDLFYRLDVVALELTPLRERPEDILPLARHFLSPPGTTGDAKRISSAAAHALLAHPWPGNVRELSNAMARARLLARADVVMPEHLPRGVQQSGAAAPQPVRGEAAEAALIDRPRTLADAELTHIREALERTAGNRTRAAEQLGISRRGLLKKLRRLGL